MEKPKSATMRPTIQSSDISSTGDLIEKMSLLQKAIQYGDVEKAKEIVSDLAKQKTEVAIQEKTEVQPLFEDDMSVKIFVEDKDIYGSHMILRLKPSTKIGELKRMMQQKHGFPLEIQKWIVGKKIVKDEDSLHRLRVKSGGSMYLYLLSPQSIGLTREEYARKYNQQISDESSRTRSSTSTSLQTPSIEPSLQWPQNGATPGPTRAPVRNVAEDVPVFVQPEATPPAPVTTQPPAPYILNHVDVGWECTVCTYRNEPTRPGCEMCATNRPEGYKIPEGLEYKITEREQRRLARERDAEIQADEHDHRDHIYQQLDTIPNPHNLSLLGGTDPDIHRQRISLQTDGLDDETINAILEQVIPANVGLDTNMAPLRQSVQETNRGVDETDSDNNSCV